MRALLAAFAFLALAACGEATTPAQRFETMAWQIPGANDPRPITLQFDHAEQRVSGFSGCNRFSGTYTVEQNQIHFGPLMSTKMACVDAQRNRTEQTFLDALSRTDSYLHAEDSLTLYDAHALQLLRFYAQQAK